MLARLTAALLLLLHCAPRAGAQAPPAAATDTPADAAWQSPQPASTSLAPTQAAPASSTKVSKGSGVLPNDHGQVWREYDIQPYTSRVKSTVKPEQAIIDWILRETGTEIWFSEPLGILSADHDTLRVYHSPQMQRTVRDVVDRFVSGRTESHVLGLRLVTVQNPNWRTKAFPLLRPVAVQSPGVDAWLMSKENAAVLIAQLRKRTDFREHSTPNLLIHNGQSQTLTRLRPRTYMRSVRLKENTWPAHEFETGSIDEGYSLQISPLFSLDEATIDAVIKCQIDQVEQLLPVAVDVPALAGQTQRVQIQIPQLVSWRLHERFRWPANQVLLLSCGVVATPAPDRPTPFGIPLPFASGPGRADALLFLENKGRASQHLVDDTRSAEANTPNFRGRY